MGESYSFIRDRFLVGCLTVVLVVVIAGAVFLDWTGKGTDVRAVALAIVPSITSLVSLFALGKKLGEKPNYDQVKNATGEVINGQVKNAVKEGLEEHLPNQEGLS